tara:strand:- start:272 stop:448 length:177 start_codon:yes stop_codon:yes gene_type:complete
MLLRFLRAVVQMRNSTLAANTNGDEMVSITYSIQTPSLNFSTQAEADSTKSIASMPNW